MLQQTFALKQALWKREAELAAGVPVAARPDEPQHLAARLEAALKSGAQYLGCESAALYTLDEATTELKLRSSFGLPFERLEQPARPLATALADLEALLGHAVALESTTTFRPWNVPEVSQAALCVPVSSPTMPLGTLWFFSNAPRAFTGEQTNLAEIIAGRVASELERALLLHEQVQAINVQRQLDAASRMQQLALTQPSPPIEGYDVAGWSCQAGALGGAFHDWRMLADGRIALAMADACDGGVAGALVASSLRSALRGTLEGECDSASIMAYLNELLITGGSGDQWAGIVLAMLSPNSGHIEIGAAGRPSALWLRSKEPISLLKPALPLGLGDQRTLKPVSITLAAGEALLLYNRGFIESGDEQGRPLNEESLAQSLHRAGTATARQLIDVLCDRQEAHALAPGAMDRCAIAIRRLT
jgi:hypothetical protein